jgi:nucleoside-diphosphate-sugar epimerase
MSIVVTGGNGGIGRFVVRALLAQGHEVRAVDRVLVADPDCPQMLVDLKDLGQVFGALHGADAVLHLAAIPDPGGHPDEAVFGNNVLATFNVVQAAEALGIRRVAWASSICAVGVPYHPPRTAPLYLPLDEEHPLLPPDCYGLSKQVGEEICRAASRRSPLTTVSLRFSLVTYPDGYDAVVSHSDQYEHNLWTYTDVRDAARACELALTVPLEGHHPYFIVAPDTLSEKPTLELLSRSYPAVRWVGPGPQATQAPVTCARAEQELGWRAHHGWRSRKP